MVLISFSFGASRKLCFIVVAFVGIITYLLRLVLRGNDKIHRHSCLLVELQVVLYFQKIMYKNTFGVKVSHREAMGVRAHRVLGYSI